jgi:hypothetical protein
VTEVVPFFACVFHCAHTGTYIYMFTVYTLSIYSNSGGGPALGTSAFCLGGPRNEGARRAKGYELRYLVGCRGVGDGWVGIDPLVYNILLGRVQELYYP